MTPNKYAAFSDRFNGRALVVAQNLQVGRYFVVQEGRYATYDRGKLIFENGETMRAFRVWEGDWPKGEFRLSEVMAHIDAAPRREPTHKRKSNNRGGYRERR